MCYCFACCFTGRSQPGVNSPGRYTAGFSVTDCFNAFRFKTGFKPDSFKGSYILRGQRIWRSISLDNRQNADLLCTGSACTAVGLLEIIKFGLLEKQLNAFSSDDFQNPLASVLGRSDILKALILADSITAAAFDQNGNESQLTTVTRRYITDSDIKSFLLKEDWVLNNHSGRTEKYIVAIAPLVYDAKRQMTVPLFWLYYPEWQNILSCFAAGNFYSHEPVTFEDVFKKRYFMSVISKDSNVFDRSIKSVSHGQDAYLESERIKEKMNNAESDLFQY